MICDIIASFSLCLSRRRRIMRLEDTSSKTCDQSRGFELKLNFEIASA